MSEEIKFISFKKALEIVGAIQEEEHLHEPERRIFTVYDKKNRELCWFYAEETINLAAHDLVSKAKKDVQPLVEKYILEHIPDWVLDVG